MVKVIKEKNRNIFICEECNFKYLDKRLARKCENWCSKNHSCNIEITKHSIGVHNE